MTNTSKILEEYGEITKGLNFDVVTRHPLADEAELLKKLELSKDDCDLCDLLWAVEESIVFVSFISTFNKGKDSYVVYKFDSEAKYGGHHFNIATTQFPLEKNHINKGLTYLINKLNNKNVVIEMKPSKFEQITDADVCL